MMTVPKVVDDTIEKVLGHEGGYVNNPNDLGLETMWGVTANTARRHGWTGRMIDLPRGVAKKILLDEYLYLPKYDRVIDVSSMVGFEVVDTGVNMGTGVASRFLQRWLNVFNQEQRLYQDLTVDGSVGNMTINALKAYLAFRGYEGERVLTGALNCSQGAAYLAMSESREKNQTFTYGWMLNRVVNQWPCQ